MFELQPYQPSLSAAWLFQRSMALRMGLLKEPRGRRGAVSGFLPPDHVNRLLSANFRIMQARTRLGKYHGLPSLLVPLWSQESRHGHVGVNRFSLLMLP